MPTTTQTPLPTTTPSSLTVQFEIVDEAGAPVAADVWLSVIHNDDSQDIPIQMNTTSESFTLPDEPTDDYYITVWASGQLLWNARIPPEALEQPVLTGTLVLEKLDEN